jgi:hypothetical protein
VGRILRRASLRRERKLYSAESQNDIEQSSSSAAIIQIALQRHADEVGDRIRQLLLGEVS